jgi:hypothetical protein
MDSSLKLLLVALLIVGVVALSVVPKDHGTGSFQTVNGPTTVFAGLRAAMLVMLLLAAAMAATRFRPSQTAAVRAMAGPNRSCTMLC